MERGKEGGTLQPQGRLRRGLPSPGRGLQEGSLPEASPVLLHPQVGARAAPEHPRSGSAVQSSLPVQLPGHRAEGAEPRQGDGQP